MRWLFLLILPLLSFASTPSTRHLTLFFNQAVRETRNAVHGKQFDAGFASQHFVLWDYAEDAPKDRTYTEHYAQLFLFLVEQQISKVILFPKDPDGTGNDFFKISNQNVKDENCFAYWVNLISKAGVKIEILFEFDPFNPSGTATPTYSLPNNFYFVDLPQKMNWLKSLIMIVPGTILGVTIDPEGPNSGGNDGYQQVINYIDQYRFANGLPSLQTAMTFGVDGKPMTFANLDTFPVDANYVTPPPTTYFPANPLPTYRTPGNNAPLLNTVYLQAYEPDFTLVFTKNLDPNAAADTFIQALQDIPYKTSFGKITTTAMVPTGSYVDGGQFVSTGTITCTMGSPNGSYSGSNFNKEITPGAYLDFNQSGTIVPIGQVHDVDANAMTFTFKDTTNGANVTVNNQPFVLSQFGIEILSGGTIDTLAGAKIGAIDGPIVFGNMGYSPSIHQFNFLSGPNQTLADQQFLCQEVVMKWIYPPITPAIAAGINFLFSVQYDETTGDLYFGNWTLANFMAFVNRFTSQVGGTNPANPIFYDAGMGGVGLPSTNIGIYDYYLLLNTNANPAQNTSPPAAPNPIPKPANPWFPEFPAP